MTTLSEDLGYMRTAAADAIAILGNDTLLQLEQNREKQAALCYLAIVTGEMAARISNRKEHLAYPGIDWRRIADMRNLLAHQPENVKMPIVFDTVTLRYPNLIAAIDAIVQDLP